MNSFECYFKWWDRRTKHPAWVAVSYSSKDCETLEECYAMCIAYAYQHGYRPRKWWQFWRWDDETPDFERIMFYIYDDYNHNGGYKR